MILLLHKLPWTTALVESIDKAGLSWMESLRSTGLNNRMMELSALGSLPVLVIIGIVTVLYLYARGRKKTTGRIFFVMVSAEVVAYAAKHLVARPRPVDFFAPGVKDSIGSNINVSFPSGHSMMAAVMYLCVAFLLYNAAENRRPRQVLAATAVALVVIIGLSRVYLGVHNPSDVLAGWLGGIGWTLTWFALFSTRDQRKRAQAP